MFLVERVTMFIESGSGIVSFHLNVRRSTLFAFILFYSESNVMFVSDV